MDWPNLGNKMNLTKSLNINNVSVFITDNNINKLKDFTSINYPKEASSLLFGEVFAEKVFIKEVFNVSNFSRTAGQFRISKEQEEQTIDKASYPLIGVYHSHLNNSKPSVCDLVSMEKKDLIWIIGYLKKIKTKNTFFKLDSYYLNNSQLYNLKMMKS